MTERVERCYAVIGRNIREARKARGWTQDDLATVLQCARNTVHRIEAGQERVMLHNIPRIARWLAVKPSALMRGVWR